MFRKKTDVNCVHEKLVMSGVCDNQAVNLVSVMWQPIIQVTMQSANRAVSRGRVNGHGVEVSRDTGCTSAVVRKSLVCDD